MIFRANRADAASNRNGLNMGSMQSVFVFVVMLLRTTFAQTDINLAKLGIVLVDSGYGTDVYNCTQEIEVNYDVLLALEERNATNLIDIFHGTSYEKLPGEPLIDEFENEGSLAKRCHPTGRVTYWDVWVFS